MSIIHVIELHCRVFICILMVSCMDSIIAIKRDKNYFFRSQTLVGVKLRQKEYILIKKILGLSFPLSKKLKHKEGHHTPLEKHFLIFKILLLISSTHLIFLKIINVHPPCIKHPRVKTLPV